MRSDFGSCRTKSIKNKMADAEMAAALQGLQAVRKYVTVAAWRSCGNSLSLWERVELIFQRFQREVGAFQEQMPGREEGRRNSEDEQEQGRASRQLVLPAPGGFNEGTPASSMELDLPRARGAHGESGGAGNSGAEDERKRPLPNSPSQLPMEDDALLGETCVNGDWMIEFFEKRKKK